MTYALPVVAIATSNVALGSPGSTFDGITLSTNPTRILLVGQTTTLQNGVWLWHTATSALTRPTGSDEYATTVNLDNATLIWVQNGNAYAGTCWGVDPAQIIKVDTTGHTLSRVALPPAQVKVASTANLSSLASVTAIDGITLIGNGTQGSDLVLLKDQTTASQNGVYWANPTGTMARSSEPLTPQRIARVSVGTVNSNTEWALVTQLPVQVGTTALTFSRQFVRANVRDFGATGNGTTDDSQAIANTIAAMSNAGGALLFPPGTYAFGSAAVVTVPANVQVTFEEAAILAPSGQTVALNGRVTAHSTQQIFGGYGSAGGMSHTAGTGPLVTVSGTYNGYPQFQVKLTTGGAVGTAQFAYSTNGGSTWSSPITTASSSPAGATGVTIAFPAGTYSTSDLYKWTSGIATASTTGLPPVTVGLTTAAVGPLISGAFVVTITTGGALSAMQFSYSLNGTTAAIGLQATGGTYVVPNTRCTITFSSGTYTLNTTYSWNSTPAILLTPLAADQLSVKWWGATGNGVTDDAAAIQAALNAGGTQPMVVYFPTGTYQVTVPADGVGLTVLIHPVIMRGAGTASGNSRVYPTIILFNGPGTGLLIEDSGYAGAFTWKSEIHDIAFFGGATYPLDMVVVHSPYQIIEDCFFQYCNRFGLLIESGTVETDIWGYTTHPSGTKFNVDYMSCKRLFFAFASGFDQAQTTVTVPFAQVGQYGTVTMSVASTKHMAINMPLVITPTANLGAGGPGAAYYIKAINSSTSLTAEYLGNAESPFPFPGMVSAASLQVGASVCVHGRDADAGIFELCTVEDAVTAFFDQTDQGSFYNCCYSQGSRVGYSTNAVTGATYLRSISEDSTKLVADNGNSASFIVSPTIVAQIATSTRFLGNHFTVVAPSYSHLQFLEQGYDGNQYGAYLPGGFATNAANSAVNFFRQTPLYQAGLDMSFQQSTAYPFVQGSWQFRQNVGAQYYQARYNGIFGITDLGSPLGSGLFEIGNPTANTLTHWKWKQSVTFASAGTYTVYINGTGTSAGTDPGVGVDFCAGAQGINIDKYPVTVGSNAPSVTASGALTATTLVNSVVVTVATTGPLSSATVNIYAYYAGSAIQTNLNVQISTGSVSLSGVLAGITLAFPGGTYNSGNQWTFYPLWGAAQPCMSCHLEFASPSAFAAGCQVNGVAPKAETGPPAGFTWAASVTVGGASFPLTLTLVWQYDLFVTNYSATGTGIG